MNASKKIILVIFQDDIGSPLMCKALNGAWYIQGEN